MKTKNSKSWKMVNRLDARNNPCGIDIESSDGAMRICSIPDGATINGGFAFTEQYSNAKLIEATPALFEACFKALKWIEGNENNLTNSDIKSILKKAIDKANSEV